jgi:succinate-semialdehyde dehydrogenase/glutarate-semialdehyde dehydrogenase
MDPATGEVWRRYEPASRAEVEAAVARAKEAQSAWAGKPVAQRVAVLRRFHDALFRRRREVAEALTRENGKPLAESLAMEVTVTMDFAGFYADKAPGFLRAPWRSAAGLGMWRKRVRVAHEPYGVIGIISPWNYPFFLAAANALPALVTGNAVVLKPSEFTPTSGALLEQLFAEAGVPDGVFRVVQGDGATGAALCDAPVDKVFFTGSVATGRKVAVKCAGRLIPCSLELGGSDPAIVLADADLAHTASGLAWGRFSNGGQTCVAPKRVYVEAPVYDAFVAALSAALGTLRVGAGMASENDVGPMIRPQAKATLEAQRDDALARGATIAARAPAPEGAGNFFAPTILANVSPDSRVLKEETFGPLMPVVRVKDADEAIALANASEFGLSASIWSRDTARAARLAERVQAGTVVLNDVIVVAGMADVAHGGVKASGIGRSHGMAGLEECVQTKTTVADQFTGWRQPWWFGYSGAHLGQMDAFARLTHGKGVLTRLGALPGVVKLLFSPSRPV